IRSITTFVHNDQKVDIVELCGKSPAPPIFHFHLTQLMNFVYVDTLFAAYPVLTAAKCGVLNPMLFAYGNTKIPSLDAALKYINRGYLLQ
ncbi:hypothetical protein HD554DRAFT_1994992, partial [Boletus coccyginus]